MDIGQNYVCMYVCVCVCIYIYSLTKGGTNCVEDLSTNKGKFQKVSRKSKLYFNNLILKNSNFWL